MSMLQRIVGVLFAATLIAAPARAEDGDPQACEAKVGALSALIQEREALAATPCTEPANLMQALFEPGLRIRAPLAELRESYSAAVTRFFVDELAALKALKAKHGEILARAKASGVLVPDNVKALIGLAPEKRPAGEAYDLFGTPRSAMSFDKAEIALIKEIQTEYNLNYLAMEEEAKNYAERIAEPIEAFNAQLEIDLDAIFDIVKGFDATRDALSKLFFSGKFEHCLGEPDRSVAAGGQSVAVSADGAPIKQDFNVKIVDASKTRFEDLPGVQFGPPSEADLRKSFRKLPKAGPPKLPVDTAVFKRDGPSRIKASAEVAALQRDAERQLAMAETLSPIIKLGETTKAFGEALVQGFIDPIVQNVGGVLSGEKSLLEAAGGLLKNLTIDNVEGFANSVLNLAKPVIDVIDATNRFVQNGADDPFVKQVFGKGSQDLKNFFGQTFAAVNPLSGLLSDRSLNSAFDPVDPGADASPEQQLAFLDAIQAQRAEIGEIRERIDGFNNVVNGAIEKLPDLAVVVLSARGAKGDLDFAKRQIDKVNDFLNGVNKGTLAVNRLVEFRKLGTEVQTLRQQGVEFPDSVTKFADDVAPLDPTPERIALIQEGADNFPFQERPPNFDLDDIKQRQVNGDTVTPEELAFLDQNRTSGGGSGSGFDLDDIKQRQANGDTVTPDELKFLEQQEGGGGGGSGFDLDDIKQRQANGDTVTPDELAFLQKQEGGGGGFDLDDIKRRQENGETVLPEELAFLQKQEPPPRPPPPPPAPGSSTLKNLADKGPNPGGVIKVNGVEVVVGERLGLPGAFKTVFDNPTQPGVVVQVFRSKGKTPEAIAKIQDDILQEAETTRRLKKIGIKTTEDVAFRGPDGEILRDANGNPITQIVDADGNVFKQSTKADIDNSVDALLAKSPDGKLTETQFAAIAEAAVKANEKGFILIDAKAKNVGVTLDADGRPTLEAFDKDGVININDLIEHRKKLAADKKIKESEIEKLPFNLGTFEFDLSTTKGRQQLQSLFLDGPEKCCGITKLSPNELFARGTLLGDLSTPDFEAKASPLGFFQNTVPEGKSFADIDKAEIAKTLDEAADQNRAAKIDEVKAEIDTATKKKGGGGSGGAPAPLEIEPLPANLLDEQQQPFVHEPPDVVEANQKIDSFFDLDDALINLATLTAINQGREIQENERQKEQREAEATAKIVEALKKKIKTEVLRGGE